MKKCKLLLLAFMIPYVLPPQTWEGDVSTDWNTPGNWDGNQVPTNFQTAVFDGIDIKAAYTGNFINHEKT
jgi:hypothetical protein